jgi:CHAT domain-containing protein
MREFYRIRESSPGMTKLEALRESQLELLRGEGQSKAGAPYAHPFYWAPFFLMGNWL